MRLATMLVSLTLLLSSAAAQAQLVPEVEVMAPPPQARVEVQVARPSVAHTWVPGYWSWRRGQHVWVSGHWMLPPQQGMVWEAARWVQRGPRWAFVEGHWRWAAAPQPQVVYEPAPYVEQPPIAVEPPAPIVEVRPGLPFAGAVWAPGYWHWNGGHHVWVGGRWTAPRVGHVWEGDRWVRGPGGWRHERGHWRHL